jgi:hypothetical protein
LYDKKGRGRKPKLNAEQRYQVKEWTKSHPKNLRKVVALVREEYGISVSRRTIKRILRDLNFSWRRIRRNPKGEPDSEEYARKKVELEELKEQAERGEIDLYYVDESGFCLIPYVPYAWQEKGETIEIESGGKKRLNILGFLSLEHGLYHFHKLTVHKCHNSINDIWITSYGSDNRIGAFLLEYVCHFLFQSFQRFDQSKVYLRLDMLPETLNGIEFRTVCWKR